MYIGFHGTIVGANRLVLCGTRALVVLEDLVCFMHARVTKEISGLHPFSRLNGVGDCFASKTKCEGCRVLSDDEPTRSNSAQSVTASESTVNKRDWYEHTARLWFEIGSHKERCYAAPLSDEHQCLQTNLLLLRVSYRYGPDGKACRNRVL